MEDIFFFFYFFILYLYIMPKGSEGGKGKGSRPQGKGSRPQGKGSRPPQGMRNRSQSGSRSQSTNRSQSGSRSNNDSRSNSESPQGKGSRPQGKGARPQGKGSRPQGNRATRKNRANGMNIENEGSFSILLEDGTSYTFMEAFYVDTDDNKRNTDGQILGKYRSGKYDHLGIFFILPNGQKILPNGRIIGNASFADYEPATTIYYQGDYKLAGNNRIIGTMDTDDPRFPPVDYDEYRGVFYEPPPRAPPVAQHNWSVPSQRRETAAVYGFGFTPPPARQVTNADVHRAWGAPPSGIVHPARMEGFSPFVPREQPLIGAAAVTAAWGLPLSNNEL
jgi:hypothetical protein